jgi:hypothetical protein
MRESADQRGSERPTPASTTFSELIKDVARRNDEAHREAVKQRVASGRAARDQKRARDLR